MMLLSERRSEFQQIRARAIRERQRCQTEQNQHRAKWCPLLASDTIQDRLRAYRTASRIPKGRRAFVRDSNTAPKTPAVMQALRTVVLLAAFMPAAAFLSPTPSPRNFLAPVSAKKSKKAPAASGGFGAAAPSTPKKKKKMEDDEPGLARPWDTPDDEGEETRAQKRGSKKLGKRGAGAAPQPSGGMSAGVKLN